MLKIFGTKKLMTQVFTESGEVVPVTVIDLADVVIAKKNDESVHIGIGKKVKPTKADMGTYKELGFVPKSVMEVKSDILNNKKVGEYLTAEILKEIKKIDVTGTSKGKGFAGVVRRWNFAGGPKTHGQSDRHRAPGSIGAGTSPGRVWKGLKMGGRMGGKKKTVQNLEVVSIDEGNNLLLVKGAIPGGKNATIVIKVKL